MKMSSLMLAVVLAVVAGDRSVVRAAAVGLELVADGLVHPVTLTAPAGDPRLFVVEQTGRIRIIDGSGRLLEEPFLDIQDRLVDLEGFEERGLLGLAFDPEFAQNRRFYVYYSAPPPEDAADELDHRGRLSAFEVSDEDPDLADPDSERIVLEVDQHRPIHNGGALAFGPDGMLYLALGDSGTYSAGPDGARASFSQDPADLRGKILRIDVSVLPYRIPEDNPFVHRAGYRPEIFATGLRNPYRCSFDAAGEFGMLCGDVGAAGYEEINRIKAGANYGWRIKEGRHCYDGRQPLEHPEQCRNDGLTPPVLEYVNCALAEDCHGRAVIGGYVYRGKAVPDLRGRYVFGDWSAGADDLAPALYVAPPRRDGEPWPFRPLEGIEWPEDRTYVLGFGQDAEGELYVLTSSNVAPEVAKPGGRVYRLAPVRDERPVAANPPAAADPLTVAPVEKDAPRSGSTMRGGA